MTASSTAATPSFDEWKKVARSMSCGTTTNASDSSNVQTTPRPLQKDSLYQIVKLMMDGKERTVKQVEKELPHYTSGVDVRMRTLQKYRILRVSRWAQTSPPARVFQFNLEDKPDVDRTGAQIAPPANTTAVKLGIWGL